MNKGIVKENVPEVKKRFSIFTLVSFVILLIIIIGSFFNKYSIFGLLFYFGSLCGPCVFLFFLIPLIMNVISLIICYKNPNLKGKILAIIGIILSVLYTIISIVFFIIIITSPF